MNYGRIWNKVGHNV